LGLFLYVGGMKGQHILRFQSVEEAKIYVERVFLWELSVAMLRLGNVVHVIDGSDKGCSEMLYRLARNSGALSAQLVREGATSWDDITPSRKLVMPEV
jgi:hypothetical protein